MKAKPGPGFTRLKKENIYSPKMTSLTYLINGFETTEAIKCGRNRLEFADEPMLMRLVTIKNETNQIQPLLRWARSAHRT